MQKIILASRSPRRKQILELANIPFIIDAVETDESYPPGISPEQAAIHIAANKARALINKKTGENEESVLINYPVLSADTIVVLEDLLIGKPGDRTEALQMLEKLSGKTHKVITGVVISYNKKEIAFTDTTEVEFHDLHLSQIEYYVDTFKPFDKAGGYAIQEWIGTVGIKKINGDFYNVMGLPVSRVVQQLATLQM